jgi:hypothetical protein
MSQKELFQNVVAEEIFRERSNFYSNIKKSNDFWIVVSPNFVENQEVIKKIEQTQFYFQNKENLRMFVDTPSDFYAAIISTNKEFIQWFILRMGYCENIDKEILSSETYTSNGLTGQISSISNNQIIPFNKNKKYIYPDYLSPVYNFTLSYLRKLS